MMLMLSLNLLLLKSAYAFLNQHIISICIGICMNKNLWSLKYIEFNIYKNSFYGVLIFSNRAFRKSRCLRRKIIFYFDYFISILLLLL